MIINPPTILMKDSLNVAVIGAGPSGLLTARELLRENHQVTVFEKSNTLGGTWVYDPRVELHDSCLSLDPNRSIVHSSLYSSLRTNLPRPLMSFSDFSFEEKTYGDPRMFPGHQEVLKFLQDFAHFFGIVEVIQFRSEVVRVASKDRGFVVEWRSMGVSSAEEVFDAVVVCTGHHSEPRMACDIPGIEKWSRKQLHSHNYRVPDPYRDQVVVVIGSGPSSRDISREIATVAKEVHLSSRSSNIKVSKLDGFENIWQRSKIERVFNDGTVVFQDGNHIKADTILHCTGYKYHFPFLKTQDIIHVDNYHVGPLYKHVFPPQLAPRLAFVGLTFNSRLLFRMLELQSKWVALVLSGKILLPPKDKMSADVYKHNQAMEGNGILESYTRSLDYQFEYVDWLSAQVGLQIEDRVREISTSLFEQWTSRSNGFRDATLYDFPTII